MEPMATARQERPVDWDRWMARLLRRAEAVGQDGEVPVAAVVLGPNGRCIGWGSNRRHRRQDPLGHAELVALQQAAALRGSWRFNDCTLLVTLEPCPMCAQAASFFRVRRIAFGAYDPKGGGVEHGPRLYASTTCHHAPEVVGGVREGEAAALLRERSPQRRVESESQRLLALWKRLQAASPASVLNRGFVIMRDEAGRPVQTKSGVRAGQRLGAEFADGTVPVRVE